MRVDKSGQDERFQDQKSGGEVADQSRTTAAPKRYAKSDVRYWEGKLFHDAYTRDGGRVEGADWSVRIQHQGRRESFPLHTPNKAVAAAKAKQVFSVLIGGGWQEALQRFKPEAVAPVRDNATVGDLIGEVMAIGGLRPKTLGRLCQGLPIDCR